MRKYLVAAALVLGACSGSSKPKPDAETGAAFGAPCTVVSDTSTECASGVCTDSVNMSSTPLCSQKCTMLGSDDPTCPNGSMGMKCNMKGYCRP